VVRITIDDETRAKLCPEGSTEIVELFDESGKFVGRLLPESGFPPPGWVPITPIPTEAELRERAAYKGPGISTEELIARLRAKP
jgi:hypothetical protein